MMGPGEVPDSVAREESRQVHTYRYLRMIVPLPAAWLLGSIAAAALLGDLRDSISDYYGSPLRDVFVGALMASGIGMIAYKGRSKLEDYALNFAGINAFFVALVSNSFYDVLKDARAVEARARPPLVPSEDLKLYIGVAVAGFVVMLIVGLALDVTLMPWARFKWSQQRGATNALILVSFAGQLLLLVLVIQLLRGVEELTDKISTYSAVHFTAAALLVVNLVFAAASYALPGSLRTAQEQDLMPTSEHPKAWRAFFLAVPSLMTIALVVGIAAILMQKPRAVLHTEWIEITLFLVFWIGATAREWSSDSIDSLSNDGASAEVTREDETNLHRD